MLEMCGWLHSTRDLEVRSTIFVKKFLFASAVAFHFSAMMIQPVFAADSIDYHNDLNLWERSRLTGDWGGVRSEWETSGVNLNMEFTQFYGALLSGTGPKQGEYGARLDWFAGFDSEKMGLWKGGGFHSHIEYRFGDLSGDLGSTFFPNNAGMSFATDDEDALVASSLFLSQRFGEKASLLVGKINVLDTLENDFFFGGWGNQRFLNTVFAAPPSGLVPPVFYGAIASYRFTPSFTTSLWIYDPEDRPLEYWPDDLFSNGVTFYLTSTYSWDLFGRSTKLTGTAIYSTRTGTDFSQVADGDGYPAGTKQGSYSLGFQFSHLIHESQSIPGEGWGLMVKGSMSDGNPNYVQRAIIVGIGGTDLFEGRPLDGFGLGYFYYNLSDALAEAIKDLPPGTSFGDEQGIEAYYSYAVTPWFNLTADVQYIAPPRSTTENAFIATLRANIRF